MCEGFCGVHSWQNGTRCRDGINVCGVVRIFHFFVTCLFFFFIIILFSSSISAAQVEIKKWCKECGWMRVDNPACKKLLSKGAI